MPGSVLNALKYLIESSEIMQRGRLNFHFLEPFPSNETIMCTDFGEFYPWGEVTTSVLVIPRVKSFPESTLPRPPVSPPNKDNGVDPSVVEAREGFVVSVPAHGINCSLPSLQVKVLWLKFEFLLHCKFPGRV